MRAGNPSEHPKQKTSLHANKCEHWNVPDWASYAACDACERVVREGASNSNETQETEHNCKGQAQSQDAQVSSRGVTSETQREKKGQQACDSAGEETSHQKADYRAAISCDVPERPGDLGFSRPCDIENSGRRVTSL
jgi:hypothetical protein